MLAKGLVMWGKLVAVPLVAAGALFAGTAGVAEGPAAPPAHPRYDGQAAQVVMVTADDPSATTVTLSAWQHTSLGWQRVLGPMAAFVGADGIGQASETTSKTPAGIWTMTEAFGIQPNDGTRLPYRQVGTSDWWVSDVTSPLYNTYYHCDPGTCPFNEVAGEDLGSAGAVYDHAVVIDYNRHPVVPSAGSAFFLHSSSGAPTAGCVAISAADLHAVMTWLDPAQHPVIDIAAGRAAGLSPATRTD